MKNYQQLALQTANPAGINVLNMALGLCGEAGEVADIVKKATQQGHELNKDKILDELGDVMWYVALGCEVMGTTIDAVMQRNIDKLKTRYGDSFSVEASVCRKV